MQTEQNAVDAKKINLCPLTAVDREIQLRVRDIRNEEGIRKWMYTSHIIDVDEHLAWIEHLKKDQSQIQLVILDESDRALGVVYATSINQLHRRCDWGYYLAEEARGGLGSAIEHAFINFVFDELGMYKLNCEIVEGNAAVVKLHKKFLFKDEGFRRSNIIKMDERLGVQLLGLSKDEWQLGRDQVYKKYRRVLDKFSIAII